MSQKKLNECSSKIIEEKFLQEDADPFRLISEVRGEINMKKVKFINHNHPKCPLEFCYHSHRLPNQFITLIEGQETWLDEEIIDYVENIYEMVADPTDRCDDGTIISNGQRASKRYLYQMMRVK